MAKKILIADDNEDVRTVLLTVLEAKGYEITQATNGVEALDKASDSPPDLIIMDVMMPKMDGYTALMKMKGVPSLKDIPIIILTGQESSIYEKISKGVGAVQHLEKPISGPELLDKVSSILDE